MTTKTHYLFQSKPFFKKINETWKLEQEINKTKKEETKLVFTSNAINIPKAYWYEKKFDKNNKLCT